MHIIVKIIVYIFMCVTIYGIVKCYEVYIIFKYVFPLTSKFLPQTLVSLNNL